MTGSLPVIVEWLVTSVHGDHDSGPRRPGRTQGADLAAVDQEFDGESLHALRATVAARAAAAGLPRPRVYEVVAAIHELAANAVQHGGGRGRLRLWEDDQLLYCQISDNGVTGKSTGARPADPATWLSGHGHGLWLVRQVADHASVNHGPDGTTAIVSFTLSPDT
ncbi:MAG: ATP-binding protein [Streptosporangiaceae bacterium]|nr:ATP-binding protein [Streptosporangiaceae bacterium]